MCIRDRYYRTVQGFQALIEKDWLAFGHKFQDRCGHVISDPNEQSPIFLQFLDAVWQMSQMFPQAFQFNENYLIAILEHTYSCQYGTFIGNCDKQRNELKLKENTYSLWGYLVTHNDEFVNPLYDRETQSQILTLNLSPQNIKFWRGLYCRFETGAHPREPIVDLLTITQVCKSHMRVCVCLLIMGKYTRNSGSEGSISVSYTHQTLPTILLV